MVPILLLVLLMFMDKWYGTPMLHLSAMQSYILAVSILIVTFSWRSIYTWLDWNISCHYTTINYVCI